MVLQEVKYLEGNGGFLLFLAPPERHQDIVNKLTKWKFDLPLMRKVQNCIKINNYDCR